MLKNHFKTAIRNLLRHKSNAVINVAGLTVGFAAFLLIFLVVQYEESFDGFHTKKDRIYRVVRIGRNPVNRGYRTGVPVPVTSVIRAELPEVANAAAITKSGDVQIIVTAKDGSVLKGFKETSGVFFAEPQFFQLFDFKLVDGDIKTAISEPNTVLLTKATASKYFGGWKGIVGKMFKMDGVFVKVTGVLDNPPPNTDFPIKAVLSYTTLYNQNTLSNWSGINDGNYCFVELASGHTLRQLTKSLSDFTNRHIKPINPDYNLSPQPLNELHYDERYGNYTGRTFSKDLILALSLIGLFLLIVACVNFINLTVAQAVNRSREVGVRKVLGGSRVQLIFQFLGETGITSLLAMFISLIIVVITIPAINNLLEIHLTATTLYSPRLMLFLSGSLVLVSFLSGFYPALVLSGFKPVTVLKGAAGSDQKRGVLFRRGLVVFQFVIAQGLIIGTLVVASQMDYFRTADMGFRKDAVIYARFPNDRLGGTKIDYLHNELLNVPGVEKLSFSMFLPSSNDGGSFTDLNKEGHKGITPDVIVNIKMAEPDFFDVYKLPIVAGRVYFASDTIHEYVVNETVIRKLGIRDPKDAIGMPVTVGGQTFPIVGVMKDFHTNSLRDPIDPVVMTTNKNGYRVANIKIDLRKTKSITAAMERIWKRDFPEFTLEYNFVDQTITNYYKQENQLSKLYTIFSGIAIFISCLGLYGLISFMAIQRRKEIGIRKVLGAPVKDIVILLSREFTMLVIVAFLIAAPLAWYFMHQWLQGYTYHIMIGLWFFAATIFSSIIIAWLTVGYTAIKAALANPVNSLRTE